MSDYIKYLDLATIELADLAFEIGDYKCALENYIRALERLNNYNGDRMQLKTTLCPLQHGIVLG